MGNKLIEFLTLAACVYVILAIIQKAEKKSYEKFNDALRNLQTPKPNIQYAIDQGLEIHYIVSTISGFIHEMIHAGCSVKYVLDYCESMEILHLVQAPVGKISKHTDTRGQIQDAVAVKITQQDLKNWLSRNVKVGDMDKETEQRFKSSFFIKIIRLGFVVSSSHV